MIAAYDEGDRLTHEELVRMTLGIFLAGHETTGSVLAWSLLWLLERRDRYARLVADPRLVPATVEELLRVQVPGEASPMRIATEDVELPSGTIRKGEAVLPSMIAANYGPAVFPDPETLVADRDGPPHLTFGRGAHLCLGANLARMELQVIVVQWSSGCPASGWPSPLKRCRGTSTPDDCRRGLQG